MLLIALIAAVWCHATGEAQGIDFDADHTEPFHGKGDDAKRPFGGGSFSRGHWTGQVSLTPWPMSKYVNRHDSKRYNRERPSSAQHAREDTDDWSIERYAVADKRPFGPGVYSRPSAHRTVKRPFGGGAIFSRPRVAGNSKSNYRRYGYSRERRRGQRQSQLSSPNYGSSTAFTDDVGDLRPADAVSRAWMKIADVWRRSRPLYNGRDSEMNDDYGDDEYNNLEFVGEPDDEDKGQSQPGAPRKLEISDNPFEEKRKTV